MSLFSKKRSSDAEQKQQAASEPFVVDDQTVARVAELMAMFNDAGGNFERQHAVGGGLCSVAGSVSTEQFLGGKYDFDEWMDRPWKMLAAVALRAARNPDHFLVARIFGFMYVWDISIAPQLDRADIVDVPMLSCPPAIEAEIATVALGSLQRLSGDWIIFSDATGSVTAGAFTIAAAKVLVHALEKGVPVEDSVMATAKRIVG